MYSQDRGPKRTRKMLTGHETFNDMKILNRTEDLPGHGDTRKTQALKR